MKFSSTDINQILKWACLGLLIRLVLMPFTMHGQDLFFINYFPMLFVEKGIYDPYAFIRNTFPEYPYSYYGPVLFIIISMANFIFIKLFNAASLVKILEISSTMMFKSLITTVDYVKAFSNLDLFKNIFLMKSPYLVFDFLIGAILLKLASSKELALKSYKLWMLNIVVLHTAYMVGQTDLIPTFFIILALYTAVKKRPYLAVVALTLGGATKLFPYVLVLPTCLLLGNSWKKRLTLLFTASILTLALYLPFYLSSGNSVLRHYIGSAAQYSGITRWILTGIFVALYTFISVKGIKDSKQSAPEKKLLFYFLAIGFLTYAVTLSRLRFFVFITPLLALLLPQHKKMAIFTLFIILMLVFLTLPIRDLQCGLFAPLNPDYFINLPTIQEIFGQFINIEIVYKIIARALLLSFFVAAWWIWRIKLYNEQRQLKFREG